MWNLVSSSNDYLVQVLNMDSLYVHFEFEVTKLVLVELVQSNN